MKVSNHLQNVACSAMISLCVILAAAASHGADPEWEKHGVGEVSNDHSVKGHLSFPKAITKALPQLIFCGSVSLEKHIGEKHLFNHISAAEHIPAAIKGGGDSLLLFGDKGGKWLRVELQIEDDWLTGVTRQDDGGIIEKDENSTLEDIESVAWYDHAEKKLLVSIDGNADPFYWVKVDLNQDKWRAQKVSNAILDGFKTEFEPSDDYGDVGIEGLTCLDPQNKIFLCIAELQGTEKTDRTGNRLAWRLKLTTDQESGGIKAEQTLPLRYEFGNPDNSGLDVGGLTSLGRSVFVLHKHWHKNEKENEMQIVRIPQDSILALSENKKGAPFRGDKELFHAQSGKYIDNSEAIVAFERNRKRYIVTFTDDNLRSDNKKQRVIATLFQLAESASSPDELLSDVELGDDCCPTARIEDRRARVEGRAGGGDAVIWVKFPPLTELGDRRPKTTINFTEYAWTGSFRSFRTRIPDSKPRRYYISASDGLVPNVTGREYDAKIDSYYVNLAPDTTAKVIFREPNTEVDDSRGTVYRWGKSHGGNFEPRGKATIDKDGLMQLADGAFRPLGVNEALFKACESSGELSIAITLKTSKQVQDGPARIVSFSKDANSRNFTLGQDGENLVLRLRTDKNDKNGTNPQVTLTKIVTGEPMHIVISYRAGLLQCYVKVNGKSVLTKSDELQGDFSNWEAMTLILGDEVNGDRDWQGSIERLVIRSHFLDSDEATLQYMSIQ